MVQILKHKPANQVECGQGVIRLLLLLRLQQEIDIRVQVSRVGGLVLLKRKVVNQMVCGVGHIHILPVQLHPAENAHQATPERAIKVCLFHAEPRVNQNYKLVLRRDIGLAHIQELHALKARVRDIPHLLRRAVPMDQVLKLSHVK